MSDPMLEKLIRFQRPDRVLGYARRLSDTTLAALFGTDEPTYRATLADLDARRAATVRALASDATYARTWKSSPEIEAADD